MGLGTKFKGDITEGLKLTLEIEPDSSRLLRYFLTMDLFLLMIRLFGFGFNLEKSRSFLNNKKRSHTQLDSRKQVIAFQDRVITINIKEAQLN